MRRIKELEKKLLIRKSAAGSADPAWEPVVSFDIPKQSLPGLDQKKINDAIKRGVAYLKASQSVNGTWIGSGHPVGCAAIGGLTLLECGAPPLDFNVQRAAFHVRSGVGNLGMTYELALAILFLDRLGEPRDRAQIQGMAMRLLAGQCEGGGWTYNCPVMSAPDMYQLLVFLHANKMSRLQDPFPSVKNAPVLPNPVKKGPNQGSDPFQQLNDLIADKEDGADAPPPEPDAKPKKGIAAGPNPKGKVKPIRPESLPVSLQKLPIVKNQGKIKGQEIVRQGVGDNSNTQFALLALWAARRHGIPSDQALLFAHRRFVLSQNPDSGWSYAPIYPTSSNTMTGVAAAGPGDGTWRRASTS